MNLSLVQLFFTSLSESRLWLWVSEQSSYPLVHCHIRNVLHSTLTSVRCWQLFFSPFSKSRRWLQVGDFFLSVSTLSHHERFPYALTCVHVYAPLSVNFHELGQKLKVSWALQEKDNDTLQKETTTLCALTTGGVSGILIQNISIAFKVWTLGEITT